MDNLIEHVKAVYAYASNGGCELVNCSICPFKELKCDKSAENSAEDLSEAAELWLFEHGTTYDGNSFSFNFEKITKEEQRFLYLSVIKSIEYWHNIIGEKINLSKTLKQGIENGISGNFLK